MKKWIIGSFVGAVILFLWQFLSWTMLGIHNGEAKYIPAQDSIMNVLNATIKEDGMYRMPNVPPDASREEHKKLYEEMSGKPYASVTYVSNYDNDMVMPMVRGFLIDFVLIFLLIYILTRAGTPTAMRIFAGSIALGLLNWLAGPYTAHNWFLMPWDAITGHLIDAFVAWGLAGLWLGWWLNRK